MVAGEAVAGLRIDRGAIPSDARNLTDRLERVEIEDRQARRDRRHRGRRFRGRNLARRAARNIQPASSGVGIDVVPAAFSADPGRLEHLVRAGLLRQPDRRERRDCRRKYQTKLSHSSSPGLV